MDYAYVPSPASKTDYAMINAGAMLSKRIGASGMIPTSANTLMGMLTYVDGKAGGVSASIGTVYIVSHASPSHVSFQLMATQTDPSVYQVLADLYKTPFPFKAPASFKLAPGQGLAPIPIVIKGCRVGRSEAFMRLFKSIIGEGVTVQAPQHFNYFMHIGNKTDRHVFDCLGYDVEIHRKARIASYKDLLSAFAGATFNRYDGSSLPSANLTTLIKQLKTEKLKTYLPDKSSTKEIKLFLNTKVSFSETVIGKKVHAMNKNMAQYRAMRVDKAVRRLKVADFAAKTIAEHVADAEAEWNAKYQSANVLGGTVKKSFAENLGLHEGEDPATFVTWVVTDEKVGAVKIKRIAAVHYRYELILPVTSVADGTLLFESETITGTALATPVTWPTNAAHLSTLFRKV